MDAHVIQDGSALKSVRAAIAMLRRAHHYRDAFTHQHQDRAAQIAVEIGRVMGLPTARLEVLHLAASVHDIGKVGIPPEIVAKPGQLTDAEYAIVKTHSGIGYDILRQLEVSLPVADIVHQHHERLDGTGYPRGLRGNEILLEARILAVADVFDAMTSYRPYREALAVDIVIGDMHLMAGTLLDKQAIEACERLVLTGSILPTEAPIARQAY